MSNEGAYPSSPPGSSRSPLPARPKELLDACENALTKHLLEYITPAFDQAGQELFDLASKAGTTEAQNRLFEAINTIKNKKTAFTEAIAAEVRESFRAFVDQEPGAGDGLTFGHQDLSLVEDQDLEEGLAITQLVSKAEIRNTQAIYALNQRLAVLNRGLPVKNDSNPCGPTKIGAALRRAASCIDVPAPQKVILFNAFDQQLQEHIAKCYKKLNDQLIEAGILPNLKLETTKAPPRPPAGPKPGQDQDPGADQQDHGPVFPPGYEPPPAPPSSPDLDFFGRAASSQLAPAQSAVDPHLVSDIRNMLSQMAQPRPAGAGPVSYAPPPALNSALSQLQDQLTQQSATAEQPRLYTAGEIKQMLSEVLGTDHATGEPMALADHHAQTIDIMGMLYDHIKQEDLLHEPVQQLLHRLQVPMIRVALQEDEFFEDSDHPARKLFNTIADAGELWLDDQPDESPTFQKMQVAVDKILDEYNDDLNVFKDLLSDLDKHIHTLSRKAKLAEKRQVEKLRGQERLELARDKARTEMERLIEQYRPPRFVESVLEHPWTDFLALTSLRYGEDGQQWKEAMSVAKTLIFSVRKELSEDLKKKLRSKVQWLKDKLSQGLSQVGYFEQDVSIVIGNLETCHRWSLAPQKKPAIPVAEPAAADAAAKAPPEAAAEPTAEPTAEPAAEPSQDLAETGEELAAVDEAEDLPVSETATEEAETPESSEQPAADESEEMDTAAANEEPTEEEEQEIASAVAAIVASEPANEEPPPELAKPVPKSQAKEEEEKQTRAVARKALPELNTAQKAQLAKIRLVAFGTWFEMENSDGDWVKRKLSWYSPVTGRCLFVNNRGAMVDEMNLHELAIAMTDDKARVFEVSQKPIIDRAFDAIFSKLKGLVSKVSPA